MYVSLSASLQYNPPSSPLRLIGVIHTRSAGFNLCAQGGFRTGQCEGPCNQKDLNSWMGEGLRIYDRDLTQSHDVCEATRFPLLTRKKYEQVQHPPPLHICGGVQGAYALPLFVCSSLWPCKVFSTFFSFFLLLFFLCIFLRNRFCIQMDGIYHCLKGCSADTSRTPLPMTSRHCKKKKVFGSPTCDLR